MTNSSSDNVSNDETASRDDEKTLPNAVIEQDGSFDKQAFLSTFTPEEDHRIMRKVDKRFLLLIGSMYLLKNIDYGNAANVKVLQVGEPRNVLIQLNMTADDYNWVQSIYFISYILFEVPSNLLLKKFSPHIWQSRIFFSWGVVLACHAAIKNKEGLYAARWFLGMMEAGFFPGVAMQLCSWYRSDEMGKPIMWMFGMQNLSGVIGSLLAYGISYLNGKGGLSAWQWVYLIEGIFTILFSAIVYLVLPDWPKSPRSNTWLTAREQQYIESRLSENAPRTSDKAFNRQEVISSILDPRTYAFMLSQLFMNLAGYGLAWYLPTITTNLGFAGLPRNQLLNIPPAAASVLAIIFAGWFLKKAYLTRPAFIIPVSIGAVVMFIVLAAVHSKAGIYVACVLGTMFYSVYFIPFWSWRSGSLKGTTGAAFTLAFQSCVGQVGGVVGPQIFRSQWADQGYKPAFWILSAATIASLLFNLWTWYLTAENEGDIKRVKRERIRATKEGVVFSGQDVSYFSEEERVKFERNRGKEV